MVLVTTIIYGADDMEFEVAGIASQEDYRRRVGLEQSCGSRRPVRIRKSKNAMLVDNCMRGNVYVQYLETTPVI
jgi:hypothetical protein